LEELTIYDRPGAATPETPTLTERSKATAKMEIRKELKRIKTINLAGLQIYLSQSCFLLLGIGYAIPFGFRYTSRFRQMNTLPQARISLLALELAPG
jgi:hypothetical protein